jgi:hypothetical protein
MHRSENQILMLKAIVMVVSEQVVWHLWNIWKRVTTGQQGAKLGTNYHECIC